jgi:hypothetical protein
MKCLSVRQPYAELIVSGRKTMERRNWNTGYRGRFVVHADRKLSPETAAILPAARTSACQGVTSNRLTGKVKIRPQKSPSMVIKDE